MSKQFTLVWLKGSKPHPIITGSIGLCQSRKKELKNAPQYKGGVLLVRTNEGLLKAPSYAGPAPKSKKVVSAEPVKIKKSEQLQIFKLHL